MTYKVAICVPNESFILPEAYENHIMLAAHQGKLEEQWRAENRHTQYEFYRFSTGRLLTALAREKMMESSIESGMDYVVMMDNDMIYPIDFLECLLQDMEQRPEIDILAPLAFMRNAPHYAVIYTTVEGYDQQSHQPYFINNFVKKYPKDTLVECDAVGFGAVVIKLSILKKMRAPYFFSTTGSGEDIYFCMKAKQEANARIFMDTRIKLGHIGKPVVIDEEYFEHWCTDNKHELPDVPHKYLTYER